MAVAADVFYKGELYGGIASLYHHPKFLAEGQRRSRS